MSRTSDGYWYSFNQTDGMVTYTFHQHEAEIASGKTRSVEDMMQRFYDMVEQRRES